MNQPIAAPPKPAAGRPRDVRWRAVGLTAILICLGGAAVQFSDKFPTIANQMRASFHAQFERRTEIDLRFRQGVAMLRASQYEHALTAFHRVLQLEPKMPEAHVNAGFALLGMKQYGVARDFFNSATELRPNQLNAYYGLAEALNGLGDHFGAMQAMETYIHLAPQDDPFRRKAEAAAWELRARLEEEKAKAGSKP